MGEGFDEIGNVRLSPWPRGVGGPGQVQGRV